MRTPAEMPRRLPLASRRLRVGALVVVLVLIFGLISLRSVARFWTDYLWFDEVHFTSVFRGVLVTKVLLALVFIVVFFVMMSASLIMADRAAPSILGPGPDDELVARYREVVAPHGRLVRLITAGVFAVFAGVGTNSQWNDWDLFRYSGGFGGATDPQWHKNVGFYVFQLPFIKFLLDWFFVAVVVVLIVTAVSHYLNGGIRFQGTGQRVTGAVKTHLSVLLAVLALIKAVDYYFQRLELVLSTNHLVDGATATNVHADAPAKQLLMVIAVLAALLFIVNVRQKGWTLPAVAVALWVLVLILVGGVYPALYQALRVSPSELTRETPYLQRNISATQTAFGLQPSQVAVKANYAGRAPLTQSDVDDSAANQQTLANIRLLDPNQVQNTFDKLQAIRNYYTFNTLSVDRYPIGGKLTQVITSARELAQANVPSGFVNQHLEYTHGYGAVAAKAGQAGINTDGTPLFSLQDIPPASGEPALSSGPGAQIYYGSGAQSSAAYVVAASKQPELDYQDPKTGAQVATTYKGTGGVPAGSLIRRAAFALRFGDPNLILSGQITSSSRVMYIRNISDRVRKAAPFLKYDADPYPVILNNRVYWVQDAYTTTANYPYSQLASTDRVPLGSGLGGSFNYVRNSVKVVINAYDGSMRFFVMQTGDPIIKVYQKAFPDLFTPVSQAESLIPGITSHWRYPEDLFRVQTNMFGRYHLSQPSDFYTQAQAWTISQDPGSGQLSSTPTGAAVTNAATGLIGPPAIRRLDPEYLLAHQPRSSNRDLTFMALQTFVAVSQSDKQQNLTAFMTAAMSNNGTAQLQVYETTPGATVDGPALINNAIRSNNQISSELTLLNQGGSQVVLGQVAAVPINETLLYVEPVYVESTSNPVPTLHDVVVVYNSTAFNSFNASLDKALCNVTNPAPDNSRPFQMYCNTAAANLPSTPPNNGSSPTGASTTTSSTSVAPPTTAVAPSGAGATVQSLLTQAQAEFAAAQAALKAGNLAGYQAAETQAQQLVAQAQQLLAAGGTTSTTLPTGGANTTSPSGATTTTTGPAPTGAPPTSAPSG